MGIFAVFAIIDHGERAALTTFWSEELFEFHGVVRNREEWSVDPRDTIS